ncbi:MAG: preprotein translocase subunit YajC [Hyphomonas sp.]|nr:preprotein translocase subunit YajC [Hyphomonas sp.]
MLTRLATLTAGAAVVTLPALAQAAPSASGPSIMSQVLLFLPLILIFYFLLIRPQQQRAKKHKALIEGIKKGDTIITSGGVIGKVTKPGDVEITVEIADGVRVQVIKQMVIEVRGKNAPVAAND